MTPDFDESLPAVSDDEFRAVRAASRPFSVAILRVGPNFGTPDRTNLDDPVMAVILRHAKRNLALHKAGILPVVCPIADGSGVSGVGIFTTTVDETRQILEADPAIAAGILTFEIHPTVTSPIPGATVPSAPEGQPVDRA
ncbi:MAG TPA: hypothetical protein VKR24_05305 [Candidatus Limnocylindrales bacterium]|nr:hypothetical protein [Candidatus Limnocylindrales bacterium]